MAGDGSGQAVARRRFVVAGIVQGVGFRPFVYRLARTGGLVGWVRNT
ncbi:MAG TPA: acylphosphatase, partial [Desulfuromonadaceae bacterium]